MAPPKPNPIESETSLARAKGTTTRSLQKKGGTLEMTDDDHSDAGCIEEAADAPSIDPLASALPAVLEGEELVVEVPLAASISRLLGVTSRSPTRSSLT